MENECIEQIILEIPQKRSGVYIILNPVRLCAYVGETEDFYRRLVEHIRSIYKLEFSSNKRLEDEECKAFEIFSLIFANYSKKCTKGTMDWIIHETIAMYLIRKHGFTLYNGTESGKDNTGNERKFLLDNSVVGDELEQRVLNYLKEKDPKFESLIDTPYTNWEDLINDAAQELNNYITSQARYQIPLSKFPETCESERIDEWNRRVNTLQTTNRDYYKITKENVGSVCYELYSKYLSKHASIAEMQHCGLRDVKPEELACLANEGKLDRIIVSKFGDYLDQSVKTILSTKQYDIENNCLKDLEGLCTVPERGDNGICFWALRRLDIESGSDLLSYHGKDKGPRYAILSYTPSICKQSSIDFRDFREKCLRSYSYSEHGEFEEYVKKEREEEKQRNGKKKTFSFEGTYDKGIKAKNIISRIKDSEIFNKTAKAGTKTGAKTLGGAAAGKGAAAAGTAASSSSGAAATAAGGASAGSGLLIAILVILALLIIVVIVSLISVFVTGDYKEENKELVLSGVGFISFNKKAKIIINTLDNIDIEIRNAMI